MISKRNVLILASSVLVGGVAVATISVHHLLLSRFRHSGQYIYVSNDSVQYLSWASDSNGQISGSYQVAYVSPQDEFRVRNFSDSLSGTQAGNQVELTLAGSHVSASATSSGNTLQVDLPNSPNVPQNGLFAFESGSSKEFVRDVADLKTRILKLEEASASGTVYVPVGVKDISSNADGSYVGEFTISHGLYGIIDQYSYNTAKNQQLYVYDTAGGSSVSESIFKQTIASSEGMDLEHVYIDHVDSSHELLTLYFFNTGSDGSIGFTQEILVDSKSHRVTFSKTYPFNHLYPSPIALTTPLVNLLSKEVPTVSTYPPDGLIVSGASHAEVIQYDPARETINVIPVSGSGNVASIRLFGKNSPIVDIKPSSNFKSAEILLGSRVVGTISGTNASPISVKKGTIVVFLGMNSTGPTYEVYSNLNNPQSLAVQPSNSNDLNDSITPPLPVGEWHFVLEWFDPKSANASFKNLPLKVIVTN